MTLRSWIVVATVLVAGCASKPPAPVAVAIAPPAPPPPPPATLPPGATPGMLVPTALADGSFPTPNQGLSVAAAVWHLRAGLNVAALSCPAQQGATITAAYNALLAGQKAELKDIEARYAAEYRSAGGADWRERYDGAMTRLYNFFSQTPVRTSFCAAAERVVAQLAALPADGLPAFAEREVATLDQPFIDFYRAYDAWRTSVGRPVMAVMASAPSTPSAMMASTAATGQRSAPPRLHLDLSQLPSDPPAGS